ncbi:unnamed protein product [marine sediment metagenome]|uniref:Uncharacterized protein n=1 Tax=marine sediment metagenome TaxID=412755 RepID=X1PAI2_9ZZZZ
MKKSLETIANEDGRFSPKALKFVLEGLDNTANAVRRPAEKMTTERKHVSGQIFCKGLKELALEKWGRLVVLVLNTWGVKTTRDFGEIVYLLTEHKWMSTQPTDSIDDFNDVYDFKTVFKDQFEF